MAENALYFGDNLDILRRYIPDESVDLIYLDPPFNSQQAYNIIFREQNGSDSTSQINAFEDTWHWGPGPALACEEVIEGGGPPARAMIAFGQLLSQNDMMAYLAMMAPRLIELRRVLKRTGTVYLHCDPTAGHYLKVLMDAVFDVANFQNEITWKRTTTKSDYREGAKNWPRIHDVLLHYAKDVGQLSTFRQSFAPYSEDYLRTKYRYSDADGRTYRLDKLVAPGYGTRRHPSYELLGVTRPWVYNREKMERLLSEGRSAQSAPGKVPQYKRYLDEVPGVAIGDFWADISPINSQAKERLGYPTQKPEALLERIILASSNEGDLILDPFCGCGTTIATAAKLKRRWIGIDITHLAINLIKYRLQQAYGDAAKSTYGVVGEPVDLAGARELAAQDPYGFQWWALGLLGARPAEQKKGADQGIDGRLYFHDEPEGGKSKQIIISVKSGRLKPDDVRALAGVVSRQEADMGVLITLHEPSRHMVREVASAGFYSPPWDNTEKYDRVQIITIADLLKGKKINRPYASEWDVSIRRAPKAKPPRPRQPRLPMSDP